MVEAERPRKREVSSDRIEQVEAIGTRVGEHGRADVEHGFAHRERVVVGVRHGHQQDEPSNRRQRKTRGIQSKPRGAERPRQPLGVQFQPPAEPHPPLVDDGTADRQPEPRPGRHAPVVAVPHVEEVSKNADAPHERHQEQQVEPLSFEEEACGGHPTLGHGFSSRIQAALVVASARCRCRVAVNPAADARRDPPGAVLKMLKNKINTGLSCHG